MDTTPEWTRADASNLIGAISLAFWLCNGIPLMWEIYKRKSADGVSLGFVGLWAVGDVLNLTGSVWAQLVPTTISVAVYYIFSDIIIIGQAVYYQRRAADKDTRPSETSPLIESPAELFLESPADSSVIYETIFNITSCLAVALLGFAGWYVSFLVSHNALDLPHTHKPRSILVGPQVLGYTSALLYLCARIPQIMKNYRKQKTDGLALLFFVFSVFGNLTYAASIIIFSTEREYLVTNAAWLLGSLGTLAFDFVILFQFLIYRRKDALPVHEAEQSLINT